ncbi:MAG: tyrosine-protein phosphatase, partial [Pseudomonadota bacterium]
MSIKPENIHVERQEGGTYQLSWEFTAPAEISVYAGTTPDAIDTNSALLKTTDTQASIDNLPATQRHYFQLQSPNGESWIAGERRLSLPNIQNFRDIGGYRTKDGRQLRWGRLYRSGHLADLTEDEHAYLQSLGLSLIVDFRMSDERKDSPTRLKDIIEPNIHLMDVWPGSATGFQAKISEGGMTLELVADFMQSINRDLVTEHTHRYAELFDLLLEHNEKPALVHCTAGKACSILTC